VELKTHVPSFTFTKKGYDRMQVDEYVGTLAEDLEQMETLRDQNRRLQAHVSRLNCRIKDLEERLSTDTPKSGVVLGERISILLRTAEDTAAETVSRAEAQAASVLAQANAKMADADEMVRAAIARGESQARSLEAAARGQAQEIIAEAEALAAARTRQIEQWTEETISRTRAEEARLLREQEEMKRTARAELQDLADQRDSVAVSLSELREVLGQALGLVARPEPAVEEAAVSLEVADAVQAVGPEDADTDNAQASTDEASAAPVPTDEISPEDVSAEAPEWLDGADTVDSDDEPAAVLVNDAEDRAGQDWAGGDDEEEGERAISGEDDFYPRQGDEGGDEVDGPVGEAPVEAIDLCDRTGEMEAVVVHSLYDDDSPEMAELDAKIDAWVSDPEPVDPGAPKHFRRN
jgi:cell division septum initiation protein DivIVA